MYRMIVGMENEADRHHKSETEISVQSEHGTLFYHCNNTHYIVAPGKWSEARTWREED